MIFKDKVPSGSIGMLALGMLFLRTQTPCEEKSKSHGEATLVK